MGVFTRALPRNVAAYLVRQAMLGAQQLLRARARATSACGQPARAGGGALGLVSLSLILSVHLYKYAYIKRDGNCKSRY